MSCTTTTAMYLNVSTTICASASASRSGNTVTVSGSFSVSQSGSYNYNAIYAYVDGQTSWTKVKPYQTSGGSWSAGFSFSFTDSGAGTRSYTAIFQVWNNAETGTVGNAASVGFSVSYPADGSAPTGLNISNISTTATSVSAVVSVTGWGGLGDASTRYRNLSVMRTSDRSDDQRRYERIYGNTMSSTITVTSSSAYGTGTVDPNTRYWLWWFATNGTYGAESPWESSTVVVTKAMPPTMSAEPIDGTNVRIVYTSQADGGYYAKNVQYSLDGGVTWVTGATVNTGSATTGSFTITGLTPNTSYTMKTRVSTNAGETDGADVTFRTYKPHGDFYGSVNDASRQINKVYGRGGNLVSFDGEIDPSSQIQFVGNVTAFNGTTFLNALKQYEYRIANWLKQNNLSLSDISGVYLDVWAITQGVPKWQLLLFHKDYDDGPAWFDNSDNISLLDLGITANITQVGDDVILLSPVYSNYNSKMANKIYGSVHTQGVTSVSGTIDPDGDGIVTAFDGDIFWEAVQKTYPERVSDIEKNFGAGSHLGVYKSEAGETEAYFIADNYGCVLTYLGYPLTLEELGMTISTSATEGMDTINLTATTGDVTRSELIYQGFGHYEYPTGPAYGIVYYKTDRSDPDSEIKSIELQNMAEFDSLCSSTLSWTATIGGGGITVSNDDTNVIIGVEIGYCVTSIGDGFLQYCYDLNWPITVPDSVLSIGDNFLLNCEIFNSSVTLPSGLATIGDMFLDSCIEFNQQIVIPDSVTSIGNYFMGSCYDFTGPLTLSSNLNSIGSYFLYACSSFNRSLSLPTTLTSIGERFLYRCDSMGSTIDVGSLSETIAGSSSYSFATNNASAIFYRVGAAIAGSNRAAWLSRFPNRTTNPYRKLRDAGH